MPAEPFVGRSGELARLRQLADEVVATGAGRLVIVTGEAGAGKSRLCGEFVRRRPDTSVATARSRCWDGTDGPALWPWSDLIGELARQRDTPLPEPSATEWTDRFGRFLVVVEQLRALTADGLTVALIDDLHVASDDAVLLTRFVVRSLHRFPLLVVATCRSPLSADARPANLDALTDDATVIELPPFGAADIADYLRIVRAREASAMEVADLLAATGGNPMYLAELVRHPSLDEAARSGGLTDVLRRRVNELSGRQRLVVATAAVLGDGARIDEVAATIGCAPAEVIATIDERRSGAFLDGTEIRFTHDLLRDVFASVLPVTDLHQLHAAAVEAIVGNNSEQTVRRARHAVAAATMSAEHRDRAITACVAAVQMLTADLAFGRAATWAATGSTLAAATSRADTQAELLLLQAGAVLACGRLAEARDLYGRAVAPAEHAAAPSLLATAALGLGGMWVEEQRDELSRRRMLQLCSRAISELGPDEATLRSLLAVRLAAERAYDGESVHDIHDAVAAVRRLDEPAATAEALSLYHHTLLSPAYAAHRLEVADELLDVASRTDGTIYPLIGLCWRTVDLYLLGDRRAERSFVELREHATALGSQSIGYIVSVLDVMRTFRRGELAAAEALATDALARGQAAGDADAFSYFGGHLLGIRWAQGRLDEMHDVVESVVDSATLRRRDRIYPALLAFTSAVRGDLVAARMLLDAVLADGLDEILELSTGAATVAILVETAVELDDGELATTLAHSFAPYANLPVMPSLAVICLGPGERTLARAHAVAGRLDEAVDAFGEALVATRRLQNAPFEAIIEAELAALLVRRGHQGDDADAFELYRTAIAAGEQMGLTGRVPAWRAAIDALAAPHPIAEPLQGRIERRADTWRVEIEGRSATIGHVVGMCHLAALIARPDTDITATELSAAVTGEPSIESTSSGAPTLDHQALASYRRRLAELDHELDRADRRGDSVAGRQAADERAFIVATLRHDTGLGGRARRLSDDGERCRMRVSKAIHRAISRVSEADPVLGRALEGRIHTGRVCRYVTDPGQPIDWRVQTAVPAV